jgi:hypothetical protein
VAPLSQFPFGSLGTDQGDLPGVPALPRWGRGARTRIDVIRKMDDVADLIASQTALEERNGELERTLAERTRRMKAAPDPAAIAHQRRWPRSAAQVRRP